MHYDKEGDSITMDQWLEHFRDREYATIGKDEIHGIHVSTVWLGLDHRFGEPGLPLIFETMCFVQGESVQQRQWSDFQWRYSTKDDAEAGHAAVIKAIRNGADLRSLAHSCDGN